MAVIVLENDSWVARIEKRKKNSKKLINTQHNSKLVIYWKLRFPIIEGTRKFVITHDCQLKVTTKLLVESLIKQINNISNISMMEGRGESKFTASLLM